MPSDAIATIFCDAPRAPLLSQALPQHYERDPFIQREFPKVGVKDIIALHVPLGVGKGAMICAHLPSVP